MQSVYRAQESNQAKALSFRVRSFSHTAPDHARAEEERVPHCQHSRNQRHGPFMSAAGFSEVACVVLVWFLFFERVKEEEGSPPGGRKVPEWWIGPAVAERNAPSS